MLKSIELSGFKSFAKKTEFQFPERISAIVGPNGSGKSNTAEAFRFALGEQSIKSLRGKKSDDLLFNGSSGVPRANRAGVRVLFDNSQNAFDLDFDEIVIERIVHRDASHDYRINDSTVRLKDVHELLAKANIGIRGHHIISQGEADRILNVKPQERKEIIEDALGLKIYHYRKKESAKKLEKTESHLHEIHGLLNEIAPRKKHLERHISRIQKARELKEKLVRDSQVYFASIEYLSQKRQRVLEEEKNELTEQVEKCRSELSALQNSSNDKEEVDTMRSEITRLEKEDNDTSSLIEKKERERGRLQGQLEILKRRLSQKESEEKILHISFKEFAHFVDTLLSLAERYTSTDLRSRAQILLNEYVEDNTDDTSHEMYREEYDDVESLLAVCEDEIKGYIHKREEVRDVLQKVRVQFENKTSKEEYEKTLIQLKDKESTIEQAISRITYEIESCVKEREALKEEVVDAGLAFGREVSNYTQYFGDDNFTPLSPEEMHDMRKEIERGKLKIEEANLREAKSIEHEYGQVKERSDFLEKEIEDLKATRESLMLLIQNLDAELDSRFQEGLVGINTEFKRFFSIMFGGGNAELVVIKDEDAEGGIEIDVELPRKRVRGLTMLSGGERSLTSIALIFAISQINPPPFIILDETDAALDEANSKRYGDMIESLSKKSQLILITHNRETMARAGALYGVTMGADGVSRVLSVKFEDAQRHAAR